MEVVPSEYALRLSERAGVTVHAHATALGKAILAFSPPELVESLITAPELPRLTPHTITGAEELRRVRQCGYAIDRAETTLLAATASISRHFQQNRSGG